MNAYTKKCGELVFMEEHTQTATVLPRTIKKSENPKKISKNYSKIQKSVL